MISRMAEAVEGLGSETKGVIERRKLLEEGEERFDTDNPTSSEKGQQLSREVRLLLLRATEGTQQYSGWGMRAASLKGRL